MPESNTPRDQAIDFYVTEFGVDREWLETLSYYQRSDEIWATSAGAIPPLASPRLPGLRILRRAPGGLKPTSVFLSFLGERITARRVSVDLETLRALLLGQWVSANATDGYVAIVHSGDVFGCGRVRDNRMRALIPTGRRRELLNALSFSATQK